MTKVYLADVDRLADPALFEKLYQTVPFHRQEKIDALRFAKDKQMCLGAWLLLIHVLQEEGLGEREIKLSYGPHGKPYLADFPNVFFNLSHSGNRVLCAVSDREVGCDVQKITDFNQRLADRFFSSEECAVIAEATYEKRDGIFFRLWALKESFVKNIGRGLSLPLKEFSIDLKTESVSVIQQVLPGETFYFREFDLSDGYRYACCARQPEIGEIVNVQLD